MPNFLLYALIAGISLAIVTGPLGSFVVWRKMAYFGDTLSHSALLGVALGFALKINLTFAIISICIVIALLLAVLQHQHTLASDTLLGILAHSSLSLGLVVISFIPNIRVDLVDYLFGDILTISLQDLYWIIAGSLITLIIILLLWQKLLSITINEELALVEGIPVVYIQLALMLLIAIIIAVAMKIVGVLLVASLLIIPPATAQHISKSPEQMAFFASIIGILAVCLGIAFSYYSNAPTGPSIVTAAAVLFIVSLMLPKKWINA